MEQQISIPDDLGSHVNRFAATNDIDTDQAYELLISVGFETFDGMDFEIYVDDGQLLLECPVCQAVFATPASAISQSCDA